MAVRTVSCADAHTDQSERASAVRYRVRGEFAEMPGLCLRVEQAARLFGLDRAETEGVLESLVDEGYLRRTTRGFTRCG